jgi:hypothetical protein
MIGEPCKSAAVEKHFKGIVRRNKRIYSHVKLFSLLRQTIIVKHTHLQSDMDCLNTVVLCMLLALQIKILLHDQYR